jgi:hypothetical protein
MTVLVKRVYEASADDESLIEEYLFAIVSDDSETRYVFADGDTISGLNDSRIEELISAYGEGSELDAKKRINIASSNIFGMGFDGPEYETIKDAISGEKELLNEAKEVREELADAANSTDEDEEDN